MRWKDKAGHALRNLFRRSSVERELDAELRFHLEREIARNIAAGMMPEEARRAALAEFGGVEQWKEDCRDMRKANWLDDIVQDVRYAVRTFLKNPGFAAVALLTLALGIGANTAIFSVVDAVLLKPLPFRQPESVVALWETESAPGSYPLTGADYLEWRSGNTAFEDMALYSWPTNANVSSSGDNEGATAVRTQANFFSLLGVDAQLGRTFAAGEDSNGGSHVIVLSDGFWKKHFGADPQVLGKSVRVDDEPYTVIGVMPAWYRLPATADFWIPLDMSKEKINRRGSHQWRAIGRLRAHVTARQGQADLQTIADRLAKQYPDNNRDVNPIVTPMREDLAGDFRTQLFVLFGAVGLVLLIACANVANLLLARATSRRREVAVRGALGAARGRLVRQLLTESILLGLAGGSTGLALAYAAVAALRAALPPELPQPNPVTVGLAPLLFTFGVSLLVGILFGLVPAIQSSSVDSRDALKSKGTVAASTSRRGQWLRDAFVASEIALSLALLIGAGLLLRTFANLRATDVGVRPAKVLTASVLLPRNRYKTFDDARSLYQELLQKVRRSPGVTEAGITNKLPLRGGINGYVMIPGQTTQAQDGPLVEFSAVDGNYFRVMGIPLLAGREFNPQDHELASNMMRRVVQIKSEEETLKVANTYTLPAIINQTMARTFWPKEDALGKIFKNFATYQIIGIVGDVRQQSLRSSVMPEAYFPMESSLYSPAVPMYVVARGEGQPESLTSGLRAAVQSLDSSLALMKVRSMPQIISESMTDTRYQAWLLGAMAALALILAAVGTFGVMSYVVGQRTNEIGIRMTLGAQRGQIVLMVLQQAGAIVAIGIVLGLAGAAGGARLMQSLLVGVKPFDPATYASVASLLILVALLACYLPVRRAMGVDPMMALRDE
jgi:predicted permease